MADLQKALRFLFWTKLPVSLGMQARRAKMFVWMVGGWNLRLSGPEKSGQNKVSLGVQGWSVLHEGQEWHYLRSENHELQLPLHSHFLF